MRVLASNDPVLQGDGSLKLLSEMGGSGGLTAEKYLIGNSAEHSFDLANGSMYMLYFGRVANENMGVITLRVGTAGTVYSTNIQVIPSTVASYSVARNKVTVTNKLTSDIMCSLIKIY